MEKFTFAKVVREHYEVEAESQKEAREELRNCDDLDEYLTERLPVDSDPIFEFRKVDN